MENAFNIQKSEIMTNSLEITSLHLCKSTTYCGQSVEYWLDLNTLLVIKTNDSFFLASLQRNVKLQRTAAAGPCLSGFKALTEEMGSAKQCSINIPPN